MRKIVFHMQTTLDNRIANADGGFWEPFPWGEEETAYIAHLFGEADTWAMGRTTYDAIVPYWDTVAAGEVPPDAPTITAADREFAAAQKKLTKVVFSTTLQPDSKRVVLRGDLVEELTTLKRQDGKNILLSCGPTTLSPIATAGLVDEYLLAVSPVVLADGPRVFEGISKDLPLELADSKVFDGGAVVLRYRAIPSWSRSTLGPA
nr:dihydrofolate reductase family protein [Kibdelosporangium sp. MJ126-NF4]CEL15816.1 Bifunctional deaminase-reductase domain protein [Kibdelosporangium sp. MJ126-NF4]CTQ93741.1 Bifunctional deaminase-reductase domain protein [Kibdelosporangium sp. MJ126-NF4]